MIRERENGIAYGIPKFRCRRDHIDSKSQSRWSRWRFWNKVENEYKIRFNTSNGGPSIEKITEAIFAQSKVI